MDRRGEGPARPPDGVERRSGERRRLPRSRWQQWPSLLASAALGVVAAVLLQSIGGATPTRRDGWVADLPARVATSLAEPSAGRSVPAPAPPRFTAEQAAALRDEAERLTPAAVALDERAASRWWPLRGELAAAEADPTLPDAVRSDLHATGVALERLGL